MLATLQRVQLLVRPIGLGQIARVLALQQREALVGKAGMDRKRHRITQTPRENLVRRVGIACLERRKDAAGGRGEHPHRRERESPLACRARLRLGFARRAGIRRRANVDEQTAGAVEHEVFERVQVAGKRRAVGELRLESGQALHDGLERHCRIGGERIEAENPVHHAGVDAAVDADGKPVRHIEAAQQHLDARALGRRRIEQQQTALLRVPAAHVGDDEETRVRHLHDGARKDQPVVFRRDQTGAETGLHGDAQLGKAAASLSGERISALCLCPYFRVRGLP